MPLCLGRPATVRRRRVLAVAGLLWAVAHLGVGAVQHARADAASAALAASRGHQRGRALIKPTIANLLLWRSVYAHDGRLYVDGVRVGTSPQVYEGRSLHALPPSPSPADLPPGSLQAEDVARSHGSDGARISLLGRRLQAAITSLR